MKILVVGGTGNTGERLVHRLMENHHTVSFLSRQPPENEIVRSLVAAGALHIHGNAGELPALVRDIDRDAIISCAHIRYAKYCAKAAHASGGLPYIQLGSARRYTKFPCPSSVEVNEAQRALEDSLMTCTILHPTMIYGGRNDRNVSRVQRWFRKRSWFPMIGDGKNLLQPIHVDDVVNAIIASVDAPMKPGTESYDIAGPDPITYREFLKRTGNSVGVRNPRLIRIPMNVALALTPIIPKISREQIQRLSEDKTVSIDHARKALNFSPRPFLSIP